jgi:hypothetical protein
MRGTQSLYKMSRLSGRTSPVPLQQHWQEHWHELWQRRRAALAFARGLASAARWREEAGQVCLHERIPGTAQPAGVTPLGLNPTAGSLPPYAKEQHFPLSSALRSPKITVYFRGLMFWRLNSYKWIRFTAGDQSGESDPSLNPIISAGDPSTNNRALMINLQLILNSNHQHLYDPFHGELSPPAIQAANRILR